MTNDSHFEVHMIKNSQKMSSSYLTPRGSIIPTFSLASAVEVNFYRRNHDERTVCFKQ